MEKTSDTYMYLLHYDIIKKKAGTFLYAFHHDIINRKHVYVCTSSSM